MPFRYHDTTHTQPIRQIFISQSSLKKSKLERVSGSGGDHEYSRPHFLPPIENC
jgi:hypothetical protein